MLPTVNVPTNDPTRDLLLEEWKECRASIDRFDKIVAELRKYGFSLITLLIGAQGLAYSRLNSEGNLEQGVLIGIYLTLMILIFGLYRLDRMYHIFIKGAVDRAKCIESQISPLKLSTQIQNITEACNTARWGDFFYILFCIANWVLALGVLLNFSNFSELRNAWQENNFAVIVCTIIMIFAIVIIASFHKDSVNAANNYPEKACP